MTFSIGIFVCTPRIKIPSARGPAAIKRNQEAHAAGGDLDQQRIIKRRDHTARIALTAVQSQPEPGRRAIGNYAAIIGREIIGWILRGHPRLHSVTDTRNVLLLGQLHYLPVQFLSLRNLDLRPHQVDAGHHFGTVFT